MLTEVVRKARKLLSPCRVCPRKCGVMRLSGQAGYCGLTDKVRVASAGAHFGEERVLTGRGGSGTIFLEGCNLGCVYCQNCEISTGHSGSAEINASQLARLMIQLQRNRVSNINFVSPTHVAPMVLEAIIIARRLGLELPIVYNCGGYESVEMLALLAGHVDVYLPDFKYSCGDTARRYSGVADYPAVAEAALAEMFRQVGPLKIAPSGLAVGGVLVRHLVLPADMAGSREVIDIVARTAPGVGINIMAQYRPAYRAAEFPELLLLPEPAKIEELRKYAQKQGLVRMD